jgi:hypothetical protein
VQQQASRQETLPAHPGADAGARQEEWSGRSRRQPEQRCAGGRLLEHRVEEPRRVRREEHIQEARLDADVTRASGQGAERQHRRDRHDQHGQEPPAGHPERTELGYGPEQHGRHQHDPDLPDQTGQPDDGRAGR